MIGGFVVALIVAFAEIYFLFKRLNEMDSLDTTKKPKLPMRPSQHIIQKSKADKKKD